MAEKENSVRSDLNELKTKFDYEPPKVMKGNEAGPELIVHHTTVPGSYYYLLGFLRGMYTGMLYICLGVSIGLWVYHMTKED